MDIEIFISSKSEIISKYWESKTDYCIRSVIQCDLLM